MKVCSKCHLPKELKDFHKDKRIKCGYRPDCKDCRKPITKAYTPVAVARIKARYKSEPTFREKAKANSAKFDKINRSEINEKCAVKSLQRGTELTFNDLRQYPELIEAKQAQLKLDREIRWQKRNQM